MVARVSRAQPKWTSSKPAHEWQHHGGGEGAFHITFVSNSSVWSGRAIGERNGGMCGATWPATSPRCELRTHRRGTARSQARCSIKSPPERGKKDAREEDAVEGGDSHYQEQDGVPGKPGCSRVTTQTGRGGYRTTVCDCNRFLCTILANTSTIPGKPGCGGVPRPPRGPPATRAYPRVPSLPRVSRVAAGCPVHPGGSDLLFRGLRVCSVPGGTHA